jgi:hypothetical protein
MRTAAVSRDFESRSESRPLAGFRCRLSHSAWFLASYRDGFFLFLLFGCAFNGRCQFPLGLCCRAMVAMLQRLDARSFFFRSRLSRGIFLPLFLKVFRDRLSCHGCQCGRTTPVQSVPFWPLGDNNDRHRRPPTTLLRGFVICLCGAESRAPQIHARRLEPIEDLTRLFVGNVARQQACHDLH